jgi:hypothetical protein
VFCGGCFDRNQGRGLTLLGNNAQTAIRFYATNAIDSSPLRIELVMSARAAASCRLQTLNREIPTLHILDRCLAHANATAVFWEG